jgi:hypothetical protein
MRPLSEGQLAVIAEHVRGRRVADYGAGNLEKAHQLAQLGATEVIAVDEERSSRAVTDPRVTVVTTRFQDYEPTCLVAFVSWPSNYAMGLHYILTVTPVVIYVGSNVNGNACGYEQMWRGLARREVLAHTLERHDSLIVYGPRRLARSALLEERGGLDQSRIYWVEDGPQQLVGPADRDGRTNLDCFDGPLPKGS